MKFGYYGDEVKSAVLYLLNNQNIDSSWDEDVFFGSEIYSTYSKDLTTALVIEALVKYRHSHQYE